MFTFQIPLLVLAAHFVGDFICQTDWMAANKSKRWDALGLHVLVYSAVVAGIVNWRFFLGGLTLSQTMLFKWFVITFATHAVTDAITSRINARFWFFQREDGIWTQAEYTLPKHGRTLVNPWSPLDGKRHWFFVGIGADQLIHALTLAWTFSVLTS